MSKTPEVELKLNLEGPDEGEFKEKMKTSFPDTFLRDHLDYRFNVDMNGVLEIAVFFQNRPFGPKIPLSDHILETARALGYEKCRIVNEVTDNVEERHSPGPEPSETPNLPQEETRPKSEFDPLGNKTAKDRASDRYNDARYG